MKHLLVSLAVVLVATPAFAQKEWETVQTGAITIKVREKPGTEIKEVWAEGQFDADVQDIQTTLMTPDRFNKFMPYVKESREFGEPAEDGSVFVYTRLNLPWVKARDYVTRVWLDEGVKEDGSGNFRNRWSAVPDKIPSRSNIIRLRFNEGSWLVTPKGAGKSHAVYKFSVDPGGWIPGFAADMGNTAGVTDTFKAVEKEAQRVGRERRTTSATVPKPEAK